MRYLLIGYALLIVVCFGPAEVENEHGAQAEFDKCMLQAQQGEGHCVYVMHGDAIFKAVFWPLWISYRVAKKLY